MASQVLESGCVAQRARWCCREWALSESTPHYCYQFLLTFRKWRFQRCQEQTRSLEFQAGGANHMTSSTVASASLSPAWRVFPPLFSSAPLDCRRGRTQQRRPLSNCEVVADYVVVVGSFAVLHHFKCWVVWGIEGIWTTTVFWSHIEWVVFVFGFFQLFCFLNTFTDVVVDTLQRKYYLFKHA